MTTRLYAHASAAGAVLCTAVTVYAATRDAGWIALGGIYTAIFFAWNARRCHTQARRERAVEQRLQRLGREDGEPFVPPPPCCSFWRHTDRQVHGPDCTRPSPRTTLTPAEELAFAQITRSFHRAGGAA